MIHQLYREQQLHCDLETAWEFFSAPDNLSKITPKDMGFTVLSNFENTAIFESMLIDYTVSPILGFPLKWKTKITQVDRLKNFTDYQQKGPYKYWNHFHEFIPNGDGVLMKDTVDYELPFGFLGNIAHALLVKKKLESIFDFRFKVLEQKFNKQNPL
ncbi:MAG: SRPBCC family protein [Chitinophagales bacterium]|nr:SRPBCC family protein [Chitinophagales bacterium]